MIVVLFLRSTRNTWCALRSATPGDRITTLCCDAEPYAAVQVQTIDLKDYDARLPKNTCPACRTELAAKSPGVAVALEPEPIPVATTFDRRQQP